MLVQKRNGHAEDFDLKKIEQVVAWAAEGFEVTQNQMTRKVEATVKLAGKAGVTSTALRQLLVNAALELVSEESPQWVYVAGRLLMMQRWADTEAARGTAGFAAYVRNQVDAGHYDAAILDHYSDTELNFAGRLIAPERDLDYDYAGARTLLDDVLLPNETPQIAYLMTALWANVHNPDNDLEFAYDVYTALSKRQVALSLRLMTSLRRDASADYSTDHGTDYRALINLAMQPDDLTLELSSYRAVCALEYIMLLNGDQNSHRPIQVGVMGLNDWLASRELTYATGKAHVNALMESVAYYTTVESVRLAETFGKCPGFTVSLWESGELTKAYQKRSNVAANWESLQARIDASGMRHANKILASLVGLKLAAIQGCTPGCMPAPATLYRFDPEGLNAPVVPPFLHENRTGYLNEADNSTAVEETVAAATHWLALGDHS